MLAIIAVLALSPSPRVMAATIEVDPPAADETLIYICRDNAFGKGYKHWIAVNDKTVARISEKRCAAVRAKSGIITLNLATMGGVLGAVLLDDRPGETAYLRWKLGDELREIGAEEGEPLVLKYKSMDPLDEERPNDQQVSVLINPGRFGLELMHPAIAQAEADDEAAVITFFRRGEKTKFDLGIWSESGLVGSIGRNQGVEIRLPPGEHYFLASSVGTSLLKANVESGNRYHVWLDYGKMLGRVRLTPVTRDNSESLSKWLEEVEMLSLNPDAMSNHVRTREKIVSEYVRAAAAKARSGAADSHELDGRHAY